MTDRSPPPALQRAKCKHLRAGEFSKHSTLTSRTVPDEENRTRYRWDLEVELCVRCSGFVLARVLDAVQDESVGALDRIGKADP